MKHSDVRIGETYLTRIGDRLEPVTVLHESTRGIIGSDRRHRTFVVRHGDRVLPKSRTAAALRQVVARVGTRSAMSAVAAQAAVSEMHPDPEAEYDYGRDDSEDPEDFNS